MLQLRSAGIPYKDWLIPGLCISASTEAEALRVADMVQRYLEQSGPRETSLMSFVARNDETFDFIFALGSRIGAVEIDGVAGFIVRDLLGGLERFLYFVLFLGYDTADGEFQPIDTKRFHLLRREVMVDGQVYEGQDLIYVDWPKLMSGT